MSLALDPASIAADVHSPMRELWKSVAGASVARVYSLVISAAMIMIVARWLGPAGQGTMAATTSWASLFATLGCLSLGQVAVHRATIRRGEPWLGETMGTLLVFDGVVTVGCWIVAGAIYVATAGKTFGALPPAALLVGMLMVPFVVWELYGSNLLTAANQIQVYNRAQLIGRSVGIVLMLVCWLLRLGVVAAIGVAVIAQVIVACTGIRELWRVAEGRVRATWSETRALLKGAAQLHVNSVSTFILSSLGVLIVNHYCTLAETGWYQFANALLNVMAVVPMAISMVLFAQVAKAGPRQAWVTQRKLLVVVPFMMIATALIAAAAAPVAIPLVVGAKYLPAVRLFQLSLFGLLGLTASGIMSSQWIGRGYFWQMSVTSIFLSAIHLTAMLLLVRRYGMYGAVYANIISSVLFIVGNGVMVFICEREFREVAAP